MSDPENEVECDRHGSTPAAFVCRHLLEGSELGFHDSGDEGDEWPDAWCGECNAILERDGEWTDENSPDLALLCTGCYETVRLRNDPHRAGGPSQLRSLEGEGHAALLERAQVHLTRTQLVVVGRLPFDREAHWHYDTEAHSMCFYDDDGRSKILADLVVAGSFSRKSSTWLWAWGNDGYASADQHALLPVKQFGEAEDVSRLASPHWLATLEDAWEVAQIAALVLEAEVEYRAPSDHLDVFLLLRRFRLAD